MPHTPVTDERLRAFIESHALPTMYLAGGDVVSMAAELLERRMLDRERRMPWSGRGVQQDGGIIEDDGA